MTAAIPTPDGVRLYLLPDGRTLVHDSRVPESHAEAYRWVVLRPGWQDAFAGWQDELRQNRRHTGTYYLSWWSALTVAGSRLDVTREELARLVALTVTD